MDGGGRYCQSRVHITVEDVNDNAPEFASETQAITVFENTALGTPVAQLQAADLDLGEQRGEAALRQGAEP